MRNHSFLYLLRPDGEEGELQRIAESNSVFPSLWKILFAGGRVASAEVRRVLRGTALSAIEVDAEEALERYERFKGLLLSPPVRPDLVEGLFRYLQGAGRHLRELVADWSLSGAASPVFCADFDEMPRPEGEPEAFLRDQLVGFSRLWSDIEQLGSRADPLAIETLLGFRSSNLRFTDWRAWSGSFGLALFEHDYFQKAFRKPFQCAYADYDYDPLGVDDDLAEGIGRFGQGDRWGVRSTHGSGSAVVLAAEWDRVLRAGIEEPDVVWVKRGGRFGLAAVRGPKAGALLIEPVLDEVGYFENGIAPVRVADKMGFLRADGAWLLTPAWDRVWPFRNGFAMVETDRHLTYIDSQGASIVHAHFDEAQHFTGHGIACVRRGGRYGLLRSTGEFAHELLYSHIEWSEPFHGWLCRRDDAFCLVRADGDHWLDGTWEQIDVCVPQQLIRVRRNARFGLLDWSGRTVVEAEYQSIEPMHVRSGALLIVRRANRVGVIDTRGEPVVPFEFSRIERLPVHDDPALSDFLLLVYSLPDRARPKAGIWDLSRGCLRAPCQYDRETLPQALMQLGTHC